MKKADVGALVEGLKELIRTGVLAMVSYLLTEGVLNGLIMNAVGNRLDPQLVLVLAGILTSALRAVDKWLHEMKVKTPLDLKSMDVLK